MTTDSDALLHVLTAVDEGNETDDAMTRGVDPEGETGDPKLDDDHDDIIPTRENRRYMHPKTVPPNLSSSKLETLGVNTPFDPHVQQKRSKAEISCAGVDAWDESTRRQSFSIFASSSRPITGYCTRFCLTYPVTIHEPLWSLLVSNDAIWPHKSTIFINLMNKFVFVFIKVILIFSKNQQEHEDHIHKINNLCEIVRFNLGRWIKLNPEEKMSAENGEGCATYDKPQTKATVPIFGGNREINLDDAYESKYSIHPSSAKTYRNLEAKYIYKCAMCAQVKVENQVSFGTKEDITIGFGMSLPRTSKISDETSRQD
ncbi:hypothetical protein LXL04_029629 [Taraxacum kok-saghyz]